MYATQILEENDMGLFFEDKKPEPPPPVVQEVKQDWLAVLIAGIISLITLVLVGLAKAYWHVLKPLLTIEGKTRQQLSVQLPLAAVLILGPLYGLYLIPAVRDAVSLNSTHTINHTNGYRIFFPDRSYFIVDSARRGGQFDSKTYITYSGYTEGTSQKMSRGQCQMVPRGEKIRLSSEDSPISAEGFKEKVGYILRQRIGTLSGASYFLEWVKRPGLWLNKLELEQTVIDVEKESSWKSFIDDWNEIRTDYGDYRSFEVRALAREHAVICF